MFNVILLRYLQGNFYKHTKDYGSHICIRKPLRVDLPEPRSGNDPTDKTFLKNKNFSYKMIEYNIYLCYHFYSFLQHNIYISPY